MSAAILSLPRPSRWYLPFLLAALAAIGLWAARNPLPPARSHAPASAAAEPTRAEKLALMRATHGPLAVPAIDGAAAEAVNRAIPLLHGPVEAAASFSLPATLAVETRARAERCLAQAVYYEAGYEPLEGRRAVAQVVLNRVRHPAFPKTVCGVVYEGSNAPGCQFSFTCNGSLARAPAPAAWSAALQVAREALAGRVEASVGEATHYHADYVVPDWAHSLGKVTQIGLHIFYRWPGGWGLRRAFTGSYAGYEAQPTPSPGLSSMAPTPPPPPRALDDRRAPNDVGGRLDVSKGWTLAFPDPKPADSALEKVRASQATTAGLP